MKNMKAKIIAYLLYLVIIIGLALSFKTMAEEYNTKNDKRLDTIEREVHQQALNDEKFIENAMYYKTQFELLSKKMDDMTKKMEINNAYVKRLDTEWVKVYYITEK